mgnify:CR=1 FL=1
MSEKKDPRLKRAGVSGYNKPKRTPNHPKKSHVVVAKEGDKVKFLYLKEPNLIHENVISFIGNLPPEFDLHKFVDYDTMFEKSFVEPLNTITQSLKWNTRPIATLEGLFT